MRRAFGYFSFLSLFICNKPLAVYGVIFSILILLAIIIVFARFYKLKSNVKLWLGDAVKIKAKCKALGKRPPKKEIDTALMTLEIAASIAVGAPVTSGPDNWPNSRIVITFKHNNKVVKKMSGKQGYSADEMETGRKQIFKKYINKEIDILYSPKYDQVLLLKPQNDTLNDSSILD